MISIAFLLHANFEQPGALIPWAEEEEISYTMHRPFKGEKLPEIDTFDCLIIMGGPQSPRSIAQYPYLTDEIELIKDSLANDKLVVGFCLGAQLIGEAFGAKTEKSPNKEIGVFSIRLKEEDAVLQGLPKVMQVMHWHEDMPGLTEDAVVLADSEGCPRQIVRYSDKAYGFQCHPEPLNEDVARMVKHCENDLQPDRYVQSKEELLAVDFSHMHQYLYTLMNNLRDLSKS